jgi:hypothetical protein
VFIDALGEQFWFSELPVLQSLDRCLMLQRALGYELVVRFQVVRERGIQIGR